VPFCPIHLPCCCFDCRPQLKHGEIHSTVHAAAVLTDTQYALEVQMSAYGLLQLLVSNSAALSHSLGCGHGSR
jgi:hypothetical protein